MIRLSLINRKKKSMDNHIEQATQYAKLSALYKTIIYLQKEIVKEQNKLKQLELERSHSIKEDKNVG